MRIEADSCSAEIDLDGGRLASLRVGDLELLVTEGSKPSRWGSFPMVPWCGRLAGGKLQHAGQVFEFPLTSPPHANHGRAYLQAWSVRESTTSRLSITTRLSDPPFDGDVLQHFELSPDHLRVTLEVHTSGSTVPAMAGWHPWFRRQLTRGGPADLRFAASSYYVNDEAQIPTGSTAPPPPPPWDHCFTDVTTLPQITWPGALVLDFESTFDHWVVYTQPEHALCIEAQSGPPNQPNSRPRLITTDQPLIGSMTLRWQ